MAFDANMSYLPAGSTFLADVYSLSKNSVLYHAGIRKGDKVHCQHSAAGDGVVYVATPMDPSKSTFTIVEEDESIKNEWLIFDHLVDEPVIKDFKDS